MRFRLGALRIGPSCLCVVPSGLDDVLILYFSCWATYTPESKTASLDCNSYTLNRRTGSVSSPISRNIIFNNLKLYFSDPSEYEHHSFSLNVFNVSLLCRGYHSPLDLQVHSQESDNGLKCLHEQMRYMYLEGPKQTKVYLGEEQEFIFENIFTRLEEDTKKEMLSPISA